MLAVFAPLFCACVLFVLVSCTRYQCFFCLPFLLLFLFVRFCFLVVSMNIALVVLPFLFFLVLVGFLTLCVCVLSFLFLFALLRKKKHDFSSCSRLGSFLSYFCLVVDLVLALAFVFCCSACHLVLVVLALSLFSSLLLLWDWCTFGFILVRVLGFALVPLSVLTSLRVFLPSSCCIFVVTIILYC